MLFDETATTMKAAMAMSTLESITAEAQTNAALARSAMLSAQSSADSATATQSDLNILASNANTLAASVANDSQTVADAASTVAEKGATAIAAIDSVVQAGEGQAESASAGLLPQRRRSTEETGKGATGETPAKKATVKGV